VARTRDLVQLHPGDPAFLSFDLRLDNEWSRRWETFGQGSLGDADVLAVWVEFQGGFPNTVWSSGWGWPTWWRSNPNGVPIGPRTVRVSGIDLTPLLEGSGYQPFRLSFVFDTGTGAWNGFGGVVLDRVVIGQSCDDGDVCNGAESCADHVCHEGTQAQDGTECVMKGGAGGVCRSGLCALVSCGDGFMEADEACDDGNLSNADDCLADCTVAACGDGFLREGSEECDTTDPATCATGCGTVGTRRCVDCAWEADCAVPQEVCNGTDDDCNGETDEGFGCVAGTSEPCTTSCGSIGARVCGPDCQPSADCIPPAEVCNGEDDNCDGAVDEIFACVPGSATPCTTVCGTVGTRICASDCTLPQDCVPPEESCNGLDDNCDGDVDEGFDCAAGSVLTCVTSCGSSSVRLCTASCTVPAECPMPQETCNGRDDDCDGVADDGFECVEGSSTDACITHCGSRGSALCNNCRWGYCFPPDNETVCDGIDDNCQNGIDEMCPRTITTDLRDEGPIYGNTSAGEPFADICPDGEVLIGVDGRGGCWFDGIQAICGRPVVVEDTSVTPYRYSVRIDPGTSMPYRGGAGGGPFSLRCPANTVMLTFQVKASDTQYVGDVMFLCSELGLSFNGYDFDLVLAGEGYIVGYSDTCPPGGYIWRAEYDARSIDWGPFFRDEAAISGIRGRAGSYVDALGASAVQMVVNP
jgi:hypothetical protein